MMHAAFDSNRYSFAINFSLREQMPQAGPDDNRTLDLINSSRAADRIPAKSIPALHCIHVSFLCHEPQVH
jgi:hypothetical protein